MTDPWEQSLPTAGWYPDPDSPSMKRYWDGHAWTDDRVDAATGKRPQLSRDDKKALVQARSDALVARRREVELRLDEIAKDACRFAGQGRVRDEIAAIEFGRSLARDQLNPKAVRQFNDHVAMLYAGRWLGRDSQPIGTIDYTGFLTKWLNNDKSPDLRVFTDRLHVGSRQTYLIDEYTNAQVYLDGQEMVTQRPSMAFMMMASPLPGSALVPGLARPKTERHDLRRAEFHAVGDGWNLAVTLNPDRISEPRRIAEAIRIQARKIEAAKAEVPAAPAPVAQVDRDDILARLERISALINSGMLTPGEGAQMKDQLLGRGPMI